jgi:hypothetical protein
MTIVHSDKTVSEIDENDIASLYAAIMVQYGAKDPGTLGKLLDLLICASKKEHEDKLWVEGF